MSIQFVRNESGQIQRQVTSIGALVLDASITEKHTMTATVPQYPVESGSSVSDDIINMPIQLQITGIVSTSSLITGIEPDSSRADSAYEQLLDIYAKREPVTILTSLEQYDNMAMTSLDIPRDSSVGEALNFTASFTQILVADVKTVTLDRVATGQRKRLAKGKQAGKQNPVVYPARFEFYGDTAISWYDSPKIPNGSIPYRWGIGR